jgi:putative ABC transport system permease protein
MTRWLSQTLALVVFNLKTLPQRRGSVAAAVVGMAFVVAVLVGVLSIRQGFARTMQASGSPEVALVMRNGADSEMTSILGRDDVRQIAEGMGIARDAQGPLASPELFVILNVPKKSTGTDANVPLRGVTRAAFGVHDKVRLVLGRRFEWGKNEVIVGRAAQEQFAGLDVGSQLRVGQNVWTVVGVFTAQGGLPESEIWTDAAVLQPAYRRGSSFQSVKVRLASPGSFERFKDSLTNGAHLNVGVQRETEFFAGQSRTIDGIVSKLGVIIGVLMGLAAVFGALNTMYTAVASRHREIATLRALGFRRLPVLVSVIAESVALAALGGTVGAVFAWLAFDGYKAATMNWASFSQVAFAFAVGPRLLTLGVAYALALGLVGGLFPAIRAARLPVATALRD